MPRAFAAVLRIALTFGIALAAGGCYLIKTGGHGYSVAVKNGSSTERIYDVGVGTPIPVGGAEMSPLICAEAFPISETLDIVPVTWTAGGVKHVINVRVGCEMTPPNEGCLLFAIGPGAVVTLYRLRPDETGIIFEKRHWPPATRPAGSLVRVILE